MPEQSFYLSFSVLAFMKLQKSCFGHSYFPPHSNVCKIMNLKVLRTTRTKEMFAPKRLLGTWKLSPENMQLCLNRTLLSCGEIEVFSNYKIADPILK